MGNRRIAEALFALAWFWIWAAHVATGLLNDLIGGHGGRTSAIVGALDSVTDAVLTQPLGRPLAVAVLALAGVGLAFFLYGTPKRHARRSAVSDGGSSETAA